jgi:hypothetical protein
VLAVAGRDIRRLPWPDCWRELEALLGGAQGLCASRPSSSRTCGCIARARRRRLGGHRRQAPNQPLSVRAAQRRLGEAEVAGLSVARDRARMEATSGPVAPFDATCQVNVPTKRRGCKPHSPAILTELQARHLGGARRVRPHRPRPSTETYPGGRPLGFEHEAPPSCNAAGRRVSSARAQWRRPALRPP